MEYQLQPRKSALSNWFAKAGALGCQIGLPVVLLVIYLEKGDRATFTSSYRPNVAGIPNSFTFTSVRLWEHADRIRNGELWEFAPLLVLCEHKPEAETLREEVNLIKRHAAEDAQSDLLAIALRVAGRKFSRGVLEAIFREELPMIKGASIIDDWISEAEQRAEARGEVVGEGRGEERGKVEEARRSTRLALSIHFGALPATLEARIDAADTDQCHEILEKGLRADSITDLIDV